MELSPSDLAGNNLFTRQRQHGIESYAVLIRLLSLFQKVAPCRSAWPAHLDPVIHQLDGPETVVVHGHAADDIPRLSRLTFAPIAQRLPNAGERAQVAR